MVWLRIKRVRETGQEHSRRREGAGEIDSQSQADRSEQRTHKRRAKSSPPD
jgi:hypothetical protein